MVERYVRDVEAAGSNPVASTIKDPPCFHLETGRVFYFIAFTKRFVISMGRVMAVPTTAA